MQVNGVGVCRGKKGRNREEGCRHGEKGYGKVEKVLGLAKEREVKEKRKGASKWGWCVKGKEK